MDQEMSVYDGYPTLSLTGYVFRVKINKIRGTYP